MYCAPTEPSPFTNRGKCFYAVDLDDKSSAVDVTFDNCILINVSFKGCVLLNVRFDNVYLEDMEFVDCDFHDCMWMNVSEICQTWTKRSFEDKNMMNPHLPEQITDPKWLQRMMYNQTIPDKFETAAAAENAEHEVLIHQYVQRSKIAADDDSRAARGQDAEPGVFDFSKLGNKVYESYSGPLNETTRLRKLQDWEIFAQQQEFERQGEREEAQLKKAMAESAEEQTRILIERDLNSRSKPSSASASNGSFKVSNSMDKGTEKSAKEARASIQRDFSSRFVKASAPGTDDLRTTSEAPAHGAQKASNEPFATQLAAIEAAAHPLQAAGGNVHIGSLPPHLRAKQRMLEQAAQQPEASEDDDEDDAPVFNPAARFVR